MTARLSRRALIGGLAGSAAAAILAACGDAATAIPTAPATATHAATTGAASTPAVAAGTNGTAAAVASPTVAPTAASTAPPAATAGSTVAAPTTTGATAAGTPAVAASTSGTAAPAAVGSPIAPATTNPNLAGRLTVYTSQVQADIDALKAAFNKVYPRVEVSVYRDGTERVIARLRTEAEAKAVAADVLLIADAPTMETLKADTLLQPYRSPNAAALPRQYVEAEGFYSGTKIIYTGIAVNTVAKPPDTDDWKALALPAFKDKVVSPSPAYSGAAALNYTVFLNAPAFGEMYLRGLKANNLAVVMSNGDALNKVISGEFPVGIVTDNGVRAAKAKGSPVEMRYPKDGAIPITEPIALVAGAKNLEPAKAFVDFVLSAEGQGLVASQNYLPLLASVPRPMGAQATIPELPFDAKAIAPKLADGKKRFADIFG